MVKSYYEGYKINGNILIRNSGLIKTQFKLKAKNGKVKKRQISEHGIGLEEGFTMLAETCIMRNIIDKNYKLSDYSAINKFARKITEIMSESLI